MSGLAPDPRSYEDTEQHHLGEGYSAKNKIPTVTQLFERQKRATAHSDADAHPGSSSASKDASSQGMSAGQQEKQEMMDKAKTSAQPTAKGFEAKGEREVLDPVTKRMVVIKDAELKDYQDNKLYSKAALDPKGDREGPATHIPDNQNLDPIGGTRTIAPNPTEPSNVLLQQFPAPVNDDSVQSIAAKLQYYSLAIIAALGVLWFFVAFGAGWKAFVFRSSIIGGLAAAVFAAHGIVGRQIEKELERIRLNMMKQRADKFTPPTPESSEWLNAFTKVVWPLINPSMFTSIVDMIEDVMAASLPGFVDAVKVNDFTIGKNALRIVSMRALPDQPHEKDYPKEEWIDQGTTDKDATLDPEKRRKMEDKQEGETEEDLDQTGDYVNMEISFAYFAPPGTKELKGENISLLIQFYLGLADWFQIPVPIWIAVESIVGTVRLRLQMVSEPPFIRNATFTLMGVPSIEASAIPLTNKLPNVLDLPLISGFVKSSVAAACSIYTAPKSMTMNLAQMMMGDGIKKDTDALGVLVIKIHHAIDLSAQDNNGFSDPYVVLAYAKFGKPLFSTRIITKDLNPVWEETAYLLVSADEVRAKEDLSVQLWDSDNTSADDLVGRIKVPLVDLMLTPGKKQNRQDKLMGFEDADAMSGELVWSVTYYDKLKLNPELKKEAGIDHNLPKELQDRPELKVETAAVDTAEEADVTRTPPDPRYPSGVLSVIIHQINNLENQNLKGATGKDREGQAGQDTDEPAEEASNIPSAYCEIIVNDDLIYKTRVKQYSTMPFFEAGTETFIHDWQKTKLRVVVRDSRLREHDPILGIIDLPLDKILAHSSEVTRLFALQDGVGFGRVNVSVLFKGLKIEPTLPKNLLGWDTGTVCITSPIKVMPEPASSFDFKEKKLILSTLEAEDKLSSSAASLGTDGSLEYAVDEHIRLPTYNRYGSAIFFDYGGGTTIGPLGTKYEAFASLWLHELVDDEEKEIRIPIVVNKGKGSIRQCVLNDQAKKTHDYEIVGWLITTVILDSGLDPDHEKYANQQTSRHEYEVYDRVEGQAEIAVDNSHANDDGVIDKKEQKQIDRAHKKALESRQRGVMQFKPVRTAVWAKDGLRDRARKLVGKGPKHEETVASELSP